MNTLSPEITIDELVRAVPARARVFEDLGIGYCCGGRKPLSEVCRTRGLEPAVVLARLEAIARDDDAPQVDLEALSVASLSDHIVRHHHAYLREDLPRLDFMTRKVAAVHGEQEPRLVELCQLFKRFGPDLAHHMHYEEEIVFPRLSALATSGSGEAAASALRGILAQMTEEHEVASQALKQIRVLTDHYTPPTWACNTFRALYDSLARLDRDLGQHFEKESSALFPRALAAVVA